VLFRAPTPAAPAERDDLALTLTTVCRSIETALEIMSFRDGEERSGSNKSLTHKL
jgi:hypothetical protein